MSQQPKGESPYQDIIGLPRHSSTRHKHMPLADRAAQFAPFAALIGHAALIQETARRTDAKLMLDEGQKDALNRLLLALAAHLDDLPEVSITYFLQDARKEGGAYVTATGCVKKVDDYERSVIMRDGTVIPIEDIVAIDGIVQVGGMG